MGGYVSLYHVNDPEVTVENTSTELMRDRTDIAGPRLQVVLTLCRGRRVSMADMIKQYKTVAYRRTTQRTRGSSESPSLSLERAKAGKIID
jgi:hypothetical protein